MTQTSAELYNYDDIWNTVYGDIQQIGPVHRHMRRLLNRELNRIDFDSVLEVGCGPGTNIDFLREGRSFQRLTGADVSDWALGQARQRFGEVADFQKLNIETEALEDQWDLVFCSLVMEHVPDDVSSLRHMKAMARKHVLISTIAGNFEKYKPWDEKMGHVRNYAVGELEEKMRSVGLEPVKSIYWGFPFYSPLVRTAQNHFSTDTHKMSATAKLIAHTLYWLYWLNASSKGDLLIVLARV